MKKSIRRILCATLAVMMGSTLGVERLLRADAYEAQTKSSSVTEKSVGFQRTEGLFDSTALREQYFNTSVTQSAPQATYETRTVIVTLSQEPLADAADGENVAEYATTFAGKRAVGKILDQQNAFLRKLDKAGISYRLEKRYETVVNGVAIEINTKHVSTIKKMSGVESAVIATTYAEPETISTGGDVVTNKTSVYETGIYDSSDFTAQYGEGMVVAILDTGLDYTHPAFQSFKNDNVTLSWDKAYLDEVLAANQLTAETKAGALTAADVYVSEKVPFAFDYADNEPDVYPSYSNHGTHVAGIIGGYDASGYTDKDGNPITDKEFIGVVPNAQLAIFKVFTDDLDDKDIGGAEAEDIIAALDDCVTLNVDVINMSLGTSGGFTTTDDGDSEGELLNAVYERIKNAGISLICAASNDYSSGYGGVYGTNLASNPDSGTVGSPSTYAAALSVASINGQKASYMIGNAGTDAQNYVFYEESRDIDGNPFDFAAELLKTNPNGEFEYVVIPGVGQPADYTTSITSKLKDAYGNSRGRIALIKRGVTMFQEKVELAMEMGAAGVIVYNNVAGIIRMNLGEIENPVPSVSVNMNAGNALVKAAEASGGIGKLTINLAYKAGPFMSEFSSWGPTHDLKLKPEITAHGGEITSTVPGGYGEQSGTSMASPNMAGFTALVRSYIEQEFGLTDGVEINRLAMQLTMSTAGMVYDQDGLPYSPRKQGAGVARLENVIGGTAAYLSTDSKENDYRPKIEFGDDPTYSGKYVLPFNITNFGASTLTFTPECIPMTETLSSDKLTVSEQAHLFDKAQAVWSVDGKEVSSIEVGAGETVKITVALTLTENEIQYIRDSFENGMYVEGFLRLKSNVSGQCDLGLPFLGFCGDWEASPMLDYSSFEIAESEQDASVKDEDKLKASVYATQPFSSYYNEKYILPMGGYVYLLPDNAEPVYVAEELCSVSRYNIYYGEGDVNNYLTSTEIRAVYAGLLKNAREVRYKLYNVDTGEIVMSDVVKRVGKAYAGGGSAVPANVELRLNPEEYGLAANGTYRYAFEFFQDKAAADAVADIEDTYSFSFTVDYDAPILEDVRVRYYNYKDGNKDKQRIYLDFDVFDNHYAQALLLCYPKQNAEGETVLQLATEYPTPIRNGNRNGTTTVSLEVTDLYERYGNQFYVQLDDYALNTCLYQIDIKEANAEVLPDSFELAAGQEALTLGLYGTHKISLEYDGTADLSNFLFTSVDPGIADVKNGEIVGLAVGKTEIVVSNRKGVSKTIAVTVTEDKQTLATFPSISFGLIKTDQNELRKAEGVVPVAAGKEFTLEVLTEPWYHPMTDLRFIWSSSKEDVATVDQNGNVKTLKKGNAIITAQIQQRVIKDGKETWETKLYSAIVTLAVQSEYTTSNSMLTLYQGVGGEVVIPTDLNLWYIGEEAFKDNDNITKIVIPASVLQIMPRAFMNCSALEEVYFVSEEKQPIADADLTLIYEQAFYNCPKLRKVDFSNVKTITIAKSAFANCPSLTEIVDWQSIGTLHHMAFANCALTSVDLTGLHMSGEYVFMNNPITEIKTGRFTAIGNYMFAGCQTLKGVLTLNTGKIGVGAFKDCYNLSGVKFQTPENTAAIEFNIGAKAFENCGKNIAEFTADFGSEMIRSLGRRAFAGTTMKTLTAMKGLEEVGADVFVGTQIKTLCINDHVSLEKLLYKGSPFTGLELTLEIGAQNYRYTNGVIYSADGKKLLYVNPSVTGEFALDNEVTEIGAYAFANSGVSSVTLTGNVTKLGVGAFADCKLTAIHFNGASLTEIPENAFSGAAVRQILLPDSVLHIGDYAFADSAVQTFQANGLSSIGNSAFEGCLVLSQVVLNDGILEMGERVFADCRSLYSIQLPSVKKLGGWTFSGSAVQEVFYGESATVTGAYTFANTSVTKVTFANGIKTLEEGLFSGVRTLKEITLPDSIERIERGVFEDCTHLSSVNGLENVRYIGDYAFFDTKLSALQLDNVLEIGAYAFAANRKGAYQSISIPSAEKIGNFAFLYGGVQSVEIPASLQQIGYGVFAMNEKLTKITVEEGSQSFVVYGGGLYRVIDKAQGTHEFVVYPTALEGAKNAETGNRTYELAEGTLKVQAYAFYGLKEGVLQAVTLPYSVNVIGDSAFFNSGVKEYTFESIQAPVLETYYRPEISSLIEAASKIAYYKGYYYANFETYIYNYSDYVKEESDLVLNYPTNGVGYTSKLYSIYFGTKNTTGIHMDDTTREMISAVENMYDVETILSWIDKESTEQRDEYLALIQSFSDEVTQARTTYNNVMKNSEQSGYVDASIGEKLTAIEKALRQVKVAYGIIVNPTRLSVASSSTHKTVYNVGEIFDPTGLIVNVTYADGSVAQIEVSGEDWTLDTTPLTTITNTVKLLYQTDTMERALTLRVMITVVDNGSASGGGNTTNAPVPVLPDNNVETVVGESAGCGAVASVFALVALLPVAIFAIAKKKE